MSKSRTLLIASSPSRRPRALSTGAARGLPPTAAPSARTRPMPATEGVLPRAAEQPGLGRSSAARRRRSRPPVWRRTPGRERTAARRRPDRGPRRAVPPRTARWRARPTVRERPLAPSEAAPSRPERRPPPSCAWWSLGCWG